MPFHEHYILLFSTVELTPHLNITATRNEHEKYYGFKYNYVVPYNNKLCSLVI
jgi:hypothetical protein